MSKQIRMDKYYKLENDTLPNDITLIRDNGASIDEIGITAVHYHHQSKYYLCSNGKHCDSEPSKDINDYFFKVNNFELQIGKSRLVEVKQIPGKHHPRIYRPVLKSNGENISRIYFSRGSQALYSNKSAFDYIAYDEKTLISSVQQLSIIIERLESIFKNVYPDQQNLNVYSHEIRNVLILACTEVEAQLKGILKANEIKPFKRDYNTKDYVRLVEILRLKAYYITFAYFPEIRSQPFTNWSASSPTDGLPWYKAYHAVKHDRENSFNQATLKNAIDATTAVCALLLAQYGFKIPYWKDLIGGFFEVANTPSWKFEDCYLPPISCLEWEKSQLIL